MDFVVGLISVMFLSTIDSIKTRYLRRRPRFNNFSEGSGSYLTSDYSSTEPQEAQKPNFQLSVNVSSKSILVTVETEREVKINWCYQQAMCVPGHTLTLNPAIATSVLLNLPHLLPCICVQVYYTHLDARRNIKCPFVNSLDAVKDVLPSSDVRLFDSSLRWTSKCLTRNLEISAALCWKLHGDICTLVSNSTLIGTKIGSLITYDTSSMDKHPQMCLQLSHHWSQRNFCNFTADMSTWEASIELSRRSVLVRVKSQTLAAFSAQLCVLKHGGCAPSGPIVSVEGTNESSVVVSLHTIEDEPCVQVWWSDLQGKRILCPNCEPVNKTVLKMGRNFASFSDSTSRIGLIAVAALLLVTILVFLVTCCRSSACCTADWLHVQKPVLLVCSSDQPQQISAACALASVLQGELGATVHMTLWSKSSGSPSSRVTDLGPLPWLYGLWDAVQEADGNILVIWSPEAKQAYQNWMEMKSDEKEEGAIGGENDTALIKPVFTAALSCLKAALQEGKSQRVSIIYFEGLGRRKDIPKPFQSFPRFCLPQQFCSLLQEIGAMRRNVNTRWRCCARSALKMQSLRLRTQLEHRLKSLASEMNNEETMAERIPAACSTLISDFSRTRVET